MRGLGDLPGRFQIVAVRSQPLLQGDADPRQHREPGAVAGLGQAAEPEVGLGGGGQAGAQPQPDRAQQGGLDAYRDRDKFGQPQRMRRFAVQLGRALGRGLFGRDRHRAAAWRTD